MKNRFKSLLTALTLAVSVSFPTLSAEALGDSPLTANEIQTAQTAVMSEDTVIYSEYLPDLNYSFNENSFLFRDALDNNNKAAYDAMKKVWLDPEKIDTSFTITFPDTISYTADSVDMSSWDTEQTDEFWNLIFSNMLYGVRSLTFDYPELFWLDTAKIKVSIGNIKTSHNFFTGKYTLKLSQLTLQGSLKESFPDTDTVLEFKKLLDDSVEAFEIKGDDRYQQLKYIHDYIANTVTYNMQAPYFNTAVGVFCEPYQVVCEGYSKAFKLICDRESIPCVAVPGNINSEAGTGHMWNYVMMEDGKWYGIDLTWDDTDKESSPVKYTYFLKGSDSFSSNHVTETGYVYPELSTNDYAYAQATEPPTVPETTVTPTEVHIQGDYNLDGNLNTADVVVLKKFIVKKITGEENFSPDDLNNDNIINTFDCMILMRKILKGI